MNIAELIIGVAGIVGGVKAVSKGLGDSEEDDQKNKITQVMSSTPYTTHVYEVRTIGQRVARIIDLARKGRDNPHVREFAVKAVSHRCGEKWCIAEKDYLGELDAVYRATRNHVRYVRDTFGKDLFQSPSRTFQFGGGDCFPGGTLIVKAPGVFVPIQDIVAGDTILDGRSWVRVLNWWEKGVLPVREFELNNGSVLRCTDDHKLFVVPRRRGGKWGTGNLPGEGDSAIEARASDVDVGDDLLQPDDPFPEGRESLPEAQAVILGAYIAEGWMQGRGKGVSIAGIPEGKGLRERVIEAARALGISMHETYKQIELGVGSLGIVSGCGTPAINKRMPNLDFDLKTIRTIVEAMDQGDGGRSTGGSNMVYSTISPTLALQYRYMQRMLGRSCHIRKVDDHGGLGKNPIYRVTVREGNRRPWAKVRSISDGGFAPCYDIQTESGRIYLPESDVVTHNCDDFSIVIASCMGAIGYPVRLRVIRTKGSGDWNHIYNTVGIPPRQPKKWVPVDASVNFGVGWQAPRRMVAEYRDFQVP